MFLARAFHVQGSTSRLISTPHYKHSLVRSSQDLSFLSLNSEPVHHQMGPYYTPKLGPNPMSTPGRTLTGESTGFHVTHSTIHWSWLALKLSSGRTRIFPVGCEYIFAGEGDKYKSLVLWPVVVHHPAIRCAIETLVPFPCPMRRAEEK